MVKTSTKRKASATRFNLTKLAKGYVTTDNQTGLEWSHTLGRATFDGAQALVDALNAERHGGHADWRRPTVEELFLIADRARSSPAIDTAVFPGTESDWYWSNTQYAPDSGYAWGVSFDNGYSDNDRHDLDDFVRAVRASQSSASRRSVKKTRS